MTAAEFVAKLLDSAPSMDELVSERDGPTLAEAQDFLQSFRCRERAERVNTGSPAGPLTDLVEAYHTEGLEVGMISFKRPEVVGRRLLFAGIELDGIYLDFDDGAISARAPSEPHETIWKCALDQSRFLEALGCLAMLLGRAAVDDAFYEDEDRRAAVATECARLAGGREYVAFYQMLLS